MRAVQTTMEETDVEIRLDVEVRQDAHSVARTGARKEVSVA
jgi:hypothetical protein